MMRSFFLVVLVLVSAALTRAAQPNIIVILADDFGYGSATCYGADPALVQTPGIDRLAAEGRKFTDANTTSSVCSPTRYSVLTGRYCWRTSLTHEVLGMFSPLHIEPTRLTIASMLKKHGYSTAAVGKWHLGYGKVDDSPRWRTDYAAELTPGPLDIGFDYHFGVPANHGDLTGVFVENRFVYGLRRGQITEAMKRPGPDLDPDDFQPTYNADDLENPRRADGILDLDAPRRKNQRVMKVLTDKAAGWIKRQPKDKPFFLYFTPVAVHNPITPDADIAGKSKAGPYGDWIHELDRSVGRLLKTLDEQGLAKNTLVIFTSDNGGVCHPSNEKQLQTTAYNAGLLINGDWRGSKHDIWEGGFKVPFLVRWPGKVKAGSVCDQMISLVDILATTAEIVGEPLPDMTEAAEDSRSFLPVLFGDPPTPIRDDMIVHSAAGVFGVRKGPWKWIEGVPADTRPRVLRSKADQFKSQLYNTDQDPAETRDLSAQYPEIVSMLRSRLKRYRDGGYSRQLPPPGYKVARNKPVKLEPLKGDLTINQSLAALPAKPWNASRGDWQAEDGGLFGGQIDGDKQPATLHVPMKLTDGEIEYEVNFRRANRMSLRVEWGDRAGSFRIVVSRSRLEVAKNPSRGEGPDAVVPLAQRVLSLDADQWYPVRISFHGNEAVVQVNNVEVKVQHQVLGESKTGMNFLVFGKTAGFRNVKVAQ